MIRIRSSSKCFGVKNIILTLMHLLALLCELFINSRTWITLRHIFHCHISFHSVNTVNKIDAVLITCTYFTEYSAVQCSYKTNISGNSIDLPTKKGRRTPSPPQQQISRNYLLLFNLYKYFWIYALFAFELSSCTWCDQIVSGLTARCQSCFQHKFLLPDVNTVVCWIISCLE